MNIDTLSYIPYILVHTSPLQAHHVLGAIFPKCALEGPKFRLAQR